MKLKTVLPRVQAVVRGHPLSAVCCPSPLRSSVCSFSPSRQKALFSAGWPQTYTITPKHFMLQKSQICTRAPGGLVKRSAQPPMKHLPHTCRDLSQSRESGQFVDSCLPRREVLITLGGGVRLSRDFKGLSTSLALYSIALFVSCRTKRTPLGRMPANVQTSAEYLMRPQWHRSLLMAIFNIRPPRSKAWHSLWTYPINNVPPQTQN